MKTIAVVNLKGGVGKTVTAINMSAILAGDHKKEVLLIDADSQCNATEFFGGDGKAASLADVLTNSLTNPDFCVQSTGYMWLDLLAADESLMDLDISALKNKTVKPDAIRNWITERAKKYEYIIIDCPPAFNAASAAALVAADEVIIPIKLDAFSLRGMTNLMRQVSNMRRVNPKLTVAGCLPTMWYKSDSTLKAAEQLRSSSLPVFNSRIRRTRKVDEMTFEQKPLTVFSPRSAAGVDYRRFVGEYLERRDTNV